MNKHCSSSYFRCKTTVLAFILSVTVMLLTDLTSAPDNKSIRIEYCQKTWKSIADTYINTAYEKYRWYLRQYSSIASTIG